MVNFLDYEGTDPSSAANEAAEAITRARTAAKDRGITAFLFQAGTAEEFDQRAEFSGVPEVLDGIADLYLGSPDQRVKLTAALRREFVAGFKPVIEAGDPCGGCPAGTKCVCTHDGCKCVKTASPNSPCWECRGTGAERCPACRRLSRWEEADPKCTTCGGKGFTDKNCTYCAGSGVEGYNEKDSSKTAAGQHCPTCGQAWGVCIHTNGEAPKHVDPVDYTAPKTSTKGEVAVCPTCRGKGSHVNPSIDAHGLTAEDFDADPDFEEAYRSGMYDMPCVECRGQRVVPQCDDANCTKPAANRDADPSMQDRRDRGSLGHYKSCYDHLDDEDLDEFEGARDAGAEAAAERRMGA